MSAFIGRFIVVSYEDGEEIDRYGLFSIFSAAEKFAKDESMKMGMSVRVKVKQILPADITLFSDLDGETICTYRRGHKLTIQTS
jgi:hypothetical protein